MSRSDRHTSRRYLVAWLPVVLIFVSASHVRVAAQRDDLKVVRLDLRAVTGLPNARVAAIEGEVDSDGLRFAIPDLSVRQPVEVWLAAGDPARPVCVEVIKFGFDGPLKDATSGSDGMAVLRFRTELGVTLVVKAATSPTPFRLAAWVGDELDVVSTPILTPMRGGTAPVRGASTYAAAAAGIIAGGLILLGALWMRRTK